MGTTIRVSDNTKNLLERLKREDESFDELLARLARDSDSMNPGVWDAEEAEAAREMVRKSRESFQRDR
jgi:predicted CopG family antitoxin